ncbi:MAG: hypothetical protein HKN13_07275, partial [Rhodothermales bacterium]|nr:hypothetical protein [Rhodothermales bacterium]
VYDLLGRKVKTLASGYLDAGIHLTAWDGRLSNGGAAASGNYYYRLETESYVLTGKMMLLK